jgi:hypothetical protein
MIRNYKFHFLFLIRLSKLLSLIFFVLCLLNSCSQNKPAEIKIAWRDSQAVSMSIPKTYLPDLHPDSLQTLFRVQLKNQKGISILGKAKLMESEIVFTPLIPFSRGMTYEVIYGQKEIDKIQIPPADTKNAPALIAVYPTTDTLPENLLKLYLQFSKPMREGESLKHISLLSSRNEPVPDVFLSLQPELWNEERTALTIWLDPGRIKRDLIPNQKLGNPLLKGEQYTLSISSDWKDIEGLPLKQSYTKAFTVTTRDSTSPKPDRWTLHLPRAGTVEPLFISTGEPLDYFLLGETIKIVDENGNIIPGSLMISDKETRISFVPGKQWRPGHYRLQVASYLEDLAGNNLNKVFDRDITAKQPTVDKSKYEKPFILK